MVFISTQYNSRLSSETLVAVTRGYAASAYLSITDNNRKALYATGPCASGKSTYAIFGLMERIRGDALVIQPSPSAARASRDAIGKRGNKRWEVVDAPEVFSNADRYANTIPRYQLVIVDEIHTETAAMAFAVECVRQRARKYILITATPTDGSGGALGVATYSVVVDESAGLGYLIGADVLDNSVWDPALWPKRLKGVIAYPVCRQAAKKLQRYYVSKGHSVSIIDKDTRDFKGDIKLVMPGVGDGLTMKATLLIDSGCDFVQVSDNNVITNRYRRLSNAERGQRWSRVGRNDCGVVLTPDMHTTAHAISPVVLATANIACQAAGLNLSLCQKRLPARVQKSKDAALYAIRKGSPLTAFYGRLGSSVDMSLMRLFVGRTYSIPAVALDFTEDVDYRKMANTIGESSEDLQVAVKKFNADKVRYRIALLQLAFGRSGKYKETINLQEQLGSQWKRLGLSMDTLDWCFLRYNTLVRERERRFDITTHCVYDSGPISLCDRHDYKTGEPQARFAASVKWLSKLPVVHVSTPEFNYNRHLEAFLNDQLLLRQGVHPNPGPRKSIQRVVQWSAALGLTVVFVRVDRDVECNSPSQIMQAYQTMRRESVSLAPVTLIVFYLAVHSRDSFVLRNDLMVTRASIIGYSIANLTKQSLSPPICSGVYVVYANNNREIREYVARVYNGALSEVCMSPTQRSVQCNLLVRASLRSYENLGKAVHTFSRHYDMPIAVTFREGSWPHVTSTRFMPVCDINLRYRLMHRRLESLFLVVSVKIDDYDGDTRIIMSPDSSVIVSGTDFHIVKYDDVKHLYVEEIVMEYNDNYAVMAKTLWMLSSDGSL